MKAALHIGTSGWHYKHWRGDFYPSTLPSSKMFQWYSQHFDTVELNNSFYRLPSHDAFLHWKDSAPEGFTFAVKASRFITHMKKLKDPAVSVEKFFERVHLLGERLGPVLFQLPPQWPANEERLESFLNVLPKRCRCVFEFRDPSWNSATVYRILRRYNAALCLHDWRAKAFSTEITADFTYLRMHGPEGTYQGAYSSEQLERLAANLARWCSELAAVYVYFNNDQGGFAVRDAISLRDLLSMAATA